MTKNPRTIVIGLDGVPYTLVKSYINKGLMPNLSSIVSNGSLFQMDTVLPEVSAAAWSS
ncbi:MAG: alkaline phosphatase family protein, partial [Vampirovibrionia bacterium]